MFPLVEFIENISANT